MTVGGVFGNPDMLPKYCQWPANLSNTNCSEFAGWKYLPSAIDYFSVDNYWTCSEFKPGADGWLHNCSLLNEDEATHNRWLYEGYIYPRLQEHQSVFVAPGIFGNRHCLPPVKGDTNPYMQPMCRGGVDPPDNATLHRDLDAMLVRKLRNYVEWINDDPRVVGMLSYTWQGSWCVHRKDDFMSLGIPDFVGVMQEMQIIGKSIQVPLKNDDGLQLPPAYPIHVGVEALHDRRLLPRRPLTIDGASSWAGPGVGLACQAKLNAFCNNSTLDKDAYNATLAPYFGLFDHNGSPGSIAWRCYSHGCLDPVTHRYSKLLAGPPSGSSLAANSTACGLGTNMGPGALQKICAVCAGTAAGVSRGQCLPAPHILDSAPARLPIQRAGGWDARFTVRGNFTGAGSTAACRVNDAHVGPMSVINSSAASCQMPCDDDASDQSAGCWFVQVEGVGTISISLDGRTFSNTLPVTFFHLALMQIGRRPYITETTGSILLRTDALALGGTSLALEATLPCVPGKRWTWANVTGGTDVLLPLSLAGLPVNLHNDLCLTVTLPSGEHLNLWRRFLRVPPPPADSTAQIVQVDHERAGLLVSTATNSTTTPLLGVGYYITEYGVSDKTVINAADEHPTNSTATLIRELQRMGRRGITWALVYWCYYVPAATAKDLVAVLDVAHAAGIGIIWDFMAPGGTDFIKAGGPYATDSQALALIKSNISLVKDHPAIIGYYICDDCCTAGVARMSQIYALFKVLDPYHPLMGAVNCDDGHAFSDGQPGTEPTSVDRTVLVLPFNKQPALQLSLDVTMLENYGRSMSSHVDDGERVKGQWQEPKVNCPPNYGFELATYSSPLAPVPVLPAAQYRTLLWLGVIRGSMTNQLNFDIGCEHPPCTLPGLADTFFEFGAELQALRSSLYASFGQTSSPLTVLISNHSANAGLLGRVYQQPALCLHLIVANTDSSRATLFTASFSAPVPQTATILFTADYSLQLSANTLTDWIGPGQSNVYELGANCTAADQERQSARRLPVKTDDSSNGGSKTYRPAVLFATPSSPGAERPPWLSYCEQAGCAHSLLNATAEDPGFELDFLDGMYDLNASRLAKYNAIVLFISPQTIRTLQETSKQDEPGEKILNATIARFFPTVHDFVEKGGGVFLFPSEQNWYRQFLPELTALFDVVLPLETLVESNFSNVAHLDHMRLEPLAFTENVIAHPITKGVKQVWFPIKEHYQAGDTGPLIVGPDWTVLLRGSPTTHTLAVNLSETGKATGK